MKYQTATAEPEPRQYYDDGNVVATNAEAIAAMLKHGLEQQAKRREALSKMTPAERDAYAHWLGTRDLTPPRARDHAASRAPLTVRATGRAPREARNDRRRGSRRGQRAPSSSSDDPDPASCACGCGRPRTAGLRYYSDECRKADQRARKRKQRAHDRANPDAAADRVAQHAVEHHAFDEIRCGCEPGDAIPSLSVDGDAECAKCGRWLLKPVMPVNGFDSIARLMEQRDLWAPRQRRALEEWRARPPRQLSVKLRQTRREGVITTA